MSTTMSATEARVHFGEILRHSEENTTITVERGGQPKAVVISVEEYEKLRSDAPEQEDWWARVLETRRLFREQLGEQEIDIDEIIRTMRDERSEQLLDNLR